MNTQKFLQNGVLHNAICKDICAEKWANFWHKISTEFWWIFLHNKVFDFHTGCASGVNLQAFTRMKVPLPNNEGGIDIILLAFKFKGEVNTKKALDKIIKIKID